MNNKSTAIDQNSRQLTVRGMVIGGIGSAVITTSSMYIALKLSSLPWPIIFVALLSMYSLKLMGNTNLNEINVTHTAMSAGAMVSGGLAFTIPGIWILNPGAEFNIIEIMLVAIGGTVLGLIFTSIIHKHFIEDNQIEFPMGVAAAETVTIGDKGGSKAKLLFVVMGITSVFTILRDWFKVIPSIFMSTKMQSYGSMGGIWLSPMLVAIGYMIGPVLVGIWFLGAVIGDVGILIIGQKSGLFTMETAAAVKQSLGIGLMVGTGVGILIKNTLPKIRNFFNEEKNIMKDKYIVNMKWAPFAVAIIVYIFTEVCGMGIAASIISVLGVWLFASVSAQCVGQSGINPMEIFGIIAMLFVKFIASTGTTELFYVAAVVAIAAGLVGDVMNDFKAGNIMKTNAKAQWIAECIGGIIGAVVSVLTLYMIFTAYGTDVIGSIEFPAAQASAVASMIGGISNVPAFTTGIIAGVSLYLAGFPIMTLGLGVYLPFYLSATAFAGAAIRIFTDWRFPSNDAKEKGNVIASGCLGGEAIVGVIISFIIAFGVM